MSEYWKSLPKYYCDFCKCWITDNKPSRDFHERGFRHQGNVRKRVQDIQRNSTVQDKERQEYNSVMAKIEASALSAFQGDIARNPSLLKEAPHLSSSASTSSKAEATASSSAVSTTNRFGQSVYSSESGESETLVNGKKRALETISKAFERKSKWLEAKTAEGTTYYWNKDTLETKHEPPKTGFLSIAEQNQFSSSASASSSSTGAPCEPLSHARLSNQYLRGGWKTVKREEELHAIDLQLPKQDVSQIMLDFRQQQQQQQQSSRSEESMIKKEEPDGEDKDKVDFKSSEEEKPRSTALREKTVADLKRPLGRGASDAPVSFKKRTTVKRSIRSREDAD